MRRQPLVVQPEIVDALNAKASRLRGFLSAATGLPAPESFATPARMSLGRLSYITEATRNRPELAIGRRELRERRAPGLKMEQRDTKLMSVEQLCFLHEVVSATLARMINAETARLDRRLRQLTVDPVFHNADEIRHARRPYPQVYPKYRNPLKPSETWAGRGKKPRWLSAQLELGKQIDDFLIAAA